MFMRNTFSPCKRSKRTENEAKTQHLHGLPVVAFHELGKNLGKILTRSWGNHGKIFGKILQDNYGKDPVRSSKKQQVLGKILIRSSNDLEKTF